MTRTRLLACPLLVALVLSGCKPGATGHSEDADGPGEPSTEARKDIEPLVKGNNEFALDLYARQRDADANLFFSPMSISVAMAMVHTGARDRTAEQIAKALHFNLEGDRLNSAIGALQWDLNKQSESGGYQLHVANALWGDKSVSFHDDFLNILKEKYGSPLRTVSFADNPHETSDAINDWVSRQTHEKIKEIVGPEDFKEELGNHTAFLLANAIYFKGEWNTKFEKKDTKGETFYLKSRKDVKVPFMSVTSTFRYLQGETFQALEMPYKGKDVSLIAFLPDKFAGIADFEKDLTADKLDGWIKKMRSTKLIVVFPPFKMQTQFELAGTLKDLGIEDAFDPEHADFKGMAEAPPMYLGFVRHKAFIELNEEGTEAAAVTAVKGSSAASGSAHHDSPKVFCADHPFLFLIRDNNSGSIMFLGRVMDPRP